jgi:uncharacterized protein (DUF4415 family)
MKEKTTGVVHFRLDASHPPKLTEGQREQLRRLREKKDTEIDFSDIPSQRGAVWTRPGALIPEGNKKQITVRLDADVLEFFKKTGTRYQSRINAALREYMKAHEKVS